MSTPDQLNKLAERMRSDWDRRIRHDYRFWMSDGYHSDHEMWQSGERDFAILMQGLEGWASKTALDLGCGVGRLLKPALKTFSKVIGFDVSAEAINKARELLSSERETSNVELHVGNGIDLKPLPDACVDVLFSFAAFGSMPTDIFASYLADMWRVLVPGGVARLQIYLGNEQSCLQNDTLHVRAYTEENFRKAIEASGFELEWAKDLSLPIQVSFSELGIQALVVSLRKGINNPKPTQLISKVLLPNGEKSGEGNPDLEYWATLNYAKELAQAGHVDQAKQALEYALSFAKSVTIDVKDLLAQIVSTVEAKHTPLGSENCFEKNLSTLKEKFSHLMTEVLNTSAALDGVQVDDTADGKVIFIAGQCQDHPQKPIAAGESWAKRLLQEQRIQDANHLVVLGFGCGYHIDALLALTTKRVSVIEPDIASFRRALEVRPQQSLGRLFTLHLGSKHLPQCFDQNCELVVRPQTLTYASDYTTKVKALFYGKRGIAALQPTIAVIGPIMGGTLPMVPYTMRALGELKQRTRDFDFGSFATGFNALETFTKDRYRQLSLQGSYCDMLSQVVLESVTERPVDIVLVLAQAPLTVRVLTELRKRGIITALWFVEDYQRFTYWRDIAKFYDFVFTIQRGECIEAIKQAGAGEVHYLPVACDPGLHTPQILSTEEQLRWGSPISFVGAGYHNRQQMFASLAEFPFKIWGTEWPACRPFDRMVQEEGRRLTPGEYIKIFNSTEVNINLHSSTERDGVDQSGDFLNPRTFELAACGAFQLVDERKLLREVFEPGKEIVTFANAEDLKEKIRYYLAHSEERKKIAEAGRMRVLREHTYIHRMDQMLSIIYSSQYERVKRRIDESPWKRMLQRSKPHAELHRRCETAFRRGEEPNLDGLVADILVGKGKLTETEQKLLFLFHVRKQIIHMRREEAGENK